MFVSDEWVHCSVESTCPIQCLPSRSRAAATRTAWSAALDLSFKEPDGLGVNFVKFSHRMAQVIDQNAEKRLSRCINRIVLLLGERERIVNKFQ